MKPEDVQIVFPLDVSTLEEGKELMEDVGEHIDLPKVGLELIHSVGTPEAVKMARDFGKAPFADVKLNDIPNTVRGAAKALTRHGVSCFNVMASGGRPMMEAAIEGAKEAAQEMEIERPKVIAVTVLTSMNLGDLAELGIIPPNLYLPYFETHGNETAVHDLIRSMTKYAKQGAITDIVLKWAEASVRAGVDVILSSPLESAEIHAKWPDKELYSPGIRMPYSSPDDQGRKLPPGEAVKRNAKYLVIGRPIREPEGGRTRKQVVQEIREDITQALS